MFKDEFYFNPKLSMFFKSPCMVSEGEGGEGEGEGGGGGGKAIALVNTDGSFTEDFYKTLPEEDRPTISRYKSLKDMAAGHINLRRKFDKDPDSLIEFPKDDSPDEVKAAFNKRRGVPDDAAGYEYELPEGLPENFTSDEEMKLYYQMAKDADLTPAQFKKMADGHFANLSESLAKAEAMKTELENQAYDKADMELNRKFGRAKEQRILRANAIMRHYGGEEAVASLKAENNPHMTLMLDRIAEDMAPARIAGIMGGASASIPTNDVINQKMNELRKTEGYYDSSHPDHKKLMEQRNQLSLQRTA